MSKKKKIFLSDFSPTYALFIFFSIVREGSFTQPVTGCTCLEEGFVVERAATHRSYGRCAV